MAQVQLNKVDNPKVDSNSGALKDKVHLSKVDNGVLLQLSSNKEALVQGSKVHSKLGNLVQLVQVHNQVQVHNKLGELDLGKAKEDNKVVHS